MYVRCRGEGGKGPFGASVWVGGSISAWCAFRGVVSFSETHASLNRTKKRQEKTKLTTLSKNCRLHKKVPFLAYFCFYNIF